MIGFFWSAQNPQGLNESDQLASAIASKPS
jgi:hypothetical protein